MGIVFKHEVTISEDFRDLLKRQRYERMVLTALNKSQELICDLPLTAVEEQSDSECDFIDSKKRKYDAKLLIDTKQGALIGERKNELKEWIRSMIDETTEFSECIRQRDLSIIKDMNLYRIMRKAIKSVKADEIAVLFIPYPIVDDFEGSIYLRFATDFLQATYDKLVEEKDILSKKALFLYPSMKEGIVVSRDAKSGSREYIELPELADYIKYSVTIGEGGDF